MEKKKAIELFAAILVAAMFISSYVSLTNYGNTGSGQNTTTTSPQTIYAQAVANGIVTGYGSPMSISVDCANRTNTNNTISNVTNVLTDMEGNNSVLEYYGSGSGFDVAAGNLSTYQIYTYFKSNFNQSQFSCMKFSAHSNVELPPYVNMTLAGQKYPIQLGGYRNVSLSLPLNYSIGTVITMKIAALVTANATIEQINITQIS